MGGWVREGEGGNGLVWMSGGVSVWVDVDE